MAQSTIHVRCYRYGSIVIHSDCGIGIEKLIQWNALFSKIHGIP